MENSSVHQCGLIWKTKVPLFLTTKNSNSENITLLVTHTKEALKA
jgi:hypothetical protein